MQALLDQFSNQINSPMGSYVAIPPRQHVARDRSTSVGSVTSTTSDYHGHYLSCPPHLRQRVSSASSSRYSPSPQHRRPFISVGDHSLAASSLHSRMISELPDLLTVFQAAPLVYQDKHTGEAVPLPALGFETERQVLTKAIHEASHSMGRMIDVDFQVATTDRLGLFLAQEEGQLMHFSCHGHPE